MVEANCSWWLVLPFVAMLMIYCASAVCVGVLGGGRNDLGLRNAVYRRHGGFFRGRRENEYGRERARQKLRPEHAEFISFALAWRSWGRGWERASGERT